MEFDVLEVHLGHLKYITAIGQEYIATFAVLRHVLVLTFLEGFEFVGIVALYPTSFIRLIGSQRHLALYSFSKRYWITSN